MSEQKECKIKHFGSKGGGYYKIKTSDGNMSICQKGNADYEAIATLQSQLLDKYREGYKAAQAEMEPLREQCRELQAKVRELEGENANHADRLDLMRDEFIRISILANPEIKGICERALIDIEQNTPLIT